MQHQLQSLNRGETLQKPFQVNWRDPPTSVYNVCVENSFSADFWAAVDGGQYDINLMPVKYRAPDTFVRLYRRHIAHLRKCWTAQQNPGGEPQRREKARHYARNSRIGTVRTCGRHDTHTPWADELTYVHARPSAPDEMPPDLSHYLTRAKYTTSSRRLAQPV